MVSGTFILRHATPRDMGAIRQFFAEHRHKFNAHRGDEVLLSSLTSRDTIQVSDKRSGNLVAVFALFHYCEGAFAEAGGTRVTSPVGGIGLQSLLIKLRALHALILNSSLEGLFTVIAADNSKSRRELSGNGFIDWDNPDAAVLAEREQILGRSIDPDSSAILKLPLEKIQQLAVEVVKLFAMENWDSGKTPSLVFSRRSISGEDTEKLEIEFQIEILLYYWPDVLALSRGENIFQA